MTIAPFSIRSSQHPDAYDERPFHMSDLPEEEVDRLRERPCLLSTGMDTATAGLFRRNRFFSGICLALPLAALFWVLGYVVLTRVLP